MLRNQVVVVHHPADDNIELSLRDHVRPPFTDAPYDWWCEYPSGAIVKGRALTKQGAHVIPDPERPAWAWVNNRTAMGFAFEGNFDDDRPPIGPSEQQIEMAAAFLGGWMAESHVIPASIDDIARVQSLKSGIIPHRLVTATACPGRHFMRQWDAFIGKVRYYYKEATT